MIIAKTILAVIGIFVGWIAVDELLHWLGWHERMFGECYATGKWKYHAWDYLGKDHRRCVVCHTSERYVATYGGIASDGEPWYRWVNERDL